MASQGKRAQQCERMAESAVEELPLYLGEPRVKPVAGQPGGVGRAWAVAIAERWAGPAGGACS